MTEDTATGPADLAGVLAEVVRLEAVAAVLDARLDASLGGGGGAGDHADGGAGAGGHAGGDAWNQSERDTRLVDLREGAPA